MRLVRCRVNVVFVSARKEGRCDHENPVDEICSEARLALDWDNEKEVGVGQMTGDVLAAASSTKGRTAIWIMNINPDGSLSGKSQERGPFHPIRILVSVRNS
jgi:hypothetical protein